MVPGKAWAEARGVIGGQARRPVGVLSLVRMTTGSQQAVGRAPERLDPKGHAGSLIPEFFCGGRVKRQQGLI